mgnify:CR=1 FL=1
MNKVIGYLNLYDSPELGKLTAKRTLGSTSFLGRFALMDFALSNFTNSGIDEINILVKDNFRSVLNHVGSLKPWINNTKTSRQNILINEKGIRDPKYNSDLNCLKENIWTLLESKADYVIFQPAHIITTMNLRPVIAEHMNSKADVTIVYSHISNADESFLKTNVLKLKDKEVVSFVKNNGKSKDADVSMETYIFSTKMLLEILNNKDFADSLSLKKVIEKIIRNPNYVVKGFEYFGYSRCFDSLDHFIDYSLELLDYEVTKALIKDDWPIYTTSHFTPPTSYGEHSKVRNSFIANGAIVKGTVQNSVISRHVVVEEGAIIKDSVILANTVIERNAVVQDAVVDKLVNIAANAVVKGTKDVAAYIGEGVNVK